MVPTAPKSRVTQSTVPSGRLTLLTRTLRVVYPPQPLNFDMSAVACPLGVLPLKDGPDSGSTAFGPVWQPGGVGAGRGTTVRENLPVAVAPVLSVTCASNVE